MKRRHKIAILALVIGVLVGLRLFHLGPFGIRAGDEVVLARFAATNGVRLCVVARRTESIGEPYVVRLYRTEASGEVFMYYMGYEDSYWWACSIRPTADPRVLHIRADGSVAAIFRLNDNSLIFPNDYYNYGTQTGRMAESNTVPFVVHAGME
ncbi:MAG TPA: hypothetical protein VFZ59_08290 [Verrucomicrobiae bacterium]|nr:hypothetical protein [Verrucomicrobiae bacterium]